MFEFDHVFRSAHQLLTYQQRLTFFSVSFFLFLLSMDIAVFLSRRASYAILLERGRTTKQLCRISPTNAVRMLRRGIKLDIQYVVFSWLVLYCFYGHTTFFRETKGVLIMFAVFFFSGVVTYARTFKAAERQATAEGTYESYPLIAGLPASGGPA